MKGVSEQNNFIYFTLALLFLLFSTALVDSIAASKQLIVVELVIFITQLVAYTSLRFGPRWRYFVVVTLLLVAGSNALHRFADWSPAPLVALSFTRVFYLGVTWMIAKRILFSDQVNLNIVVGALAIYMLLGLIWTAIYLMVLEIFPHSFSGMEHIYWTDNFTNVIYFSYITMTSVGYGDITPTLAISRTLAYMQAMFSTFYMAVVVASLVGARRNPRG